MKIFIMNGQGGSGKTTFQNFVKEIAGEKDIGVAQISMVFFVKKIANLYFGWKEDDKSPEARLMLHRLKVLLDDWNGQPFKTTCEGIDAALRDGAVVFVDAREPKDIKALKEAYPEAVTVLVVRGEKKDYGNDADNGVFDYDYDMVIHNTSDIENLKHIASVFVERMI